MARTIVSAQPEEQKAKVHKNAEIKKLKKLPAAARKTTSTKGGSARISMSQAYPLPEPEPQVETEKDMGSPMSSLPDPAPGLSSTVVNGEEGGDADDTGPSEQVEGNNDLP